MLGMRRAMVAVGRRRGPRSAEPRLAAGFGEGERGCPSEAERCEASQRERLAAAQAVRDAARSGAGMSAAAITSTKARLWSDDPERVARHRVAEDEDAAA